MDLPNRDELLAYTSPEALFGADLSDATALRRRYAALVKAFSPEDDSEAFAHLRSLYERARRGPAPEPDPTSAPAADPWAVVDAAMRAGDAQAVFDGLVGDTDALLRGGSGRFADAISWLIAHSGPWLSPSAVDALSLVLQRPDLHLDPSWLDALGLDLRRVQAIRVAVDDPLVPRPLIEGARGLWRRRPDVAAQVWAQAALALREEGVDLAAAFAYLQRTHPTVAALIRGAELRIRDLLVEPARARPAPPDIVAALRPVPELWTEANATLVAADTWASRILVGGVAYVVVVPIARFVPLLMAYPALYGATVVGAIWGARYAYARYRSRQVLAEAREAEARLLDGDRADLLVWCREHAWFPRELAHQVAAAHAPVAAGEVPYPDGHRLLELDRDPTATLQVIGPAHVARLEEAFRE